MKNSFKELKYDELLAKREELKKNYFDLRFKAIVGHVDNPVQKRVLRRQIARIETIIHRAGKPDAKANGAVAAATAAVPGAARPRATK